MPKGSINDMLAAFEDRIDELSSGLIDSATELTSSSCKDEKEPVLGFLDDEMTDIDNIVGWLQEQGNAYNDFNMYFQDTPEDEITLDTVISWISGQDALCQDFCKRFPRLAEEHELMCCTNSSTVIASTQASPEFIEKFCWEINDAIIGSDIDVEDVTCTAKNNKFILTVQLESGEEVDFEIPFSDLTCNVDTLSDDLDYVVSEVEAELQ